MGSPLSDINSKTVFIIGDMAIESIEDKIIALGYRFQKMNPLEETPTLASTRKVLIRLRASGELLAVLIFLTERILLHYCDSGFEETWLNLFQEIKLTTSLVFVSEDSLLEKFTYEKLASIRNAEAEQNLTELRKGEKYSLFHDQLRYERLKQGLTQEQLADLIGTSPTSIVRWESGKSLPQPYARRKIYEIFDKNAESFGLIGINTINSTKSSVKYIHTEPREGEKRSLFQARLRRKRSEKSLTQRELASVLGCNPQTIGQWENGKNFPGLYLQQKLCQIFDCNLEELGLSEADDIPTESQLTMKAQKVELLLKNIQDNGVEITLFKTRQDISLRVHHFLDEIDKGILLHLYVPNGRFQEDQLASFLRLFESYLQRVEKLPFFIETRKTLHGQIYEFKSKNAAMNLMDVEVALSRFDQFMSLCQNDQKKAADILLRTGMNALEASRLLTKYTKEYQRLLLDMEHEKERKMLDLRHKLESEVLDLANGTSLTLTQPMQPTSLLSLPHSNDPIGITISNSSVVINPGIQSYIEQAIYGDIYYTTEDNELLALFEKYCEQLEAVALKSQLEQLKDSSSPDVERRTAKQKIVGFLAKVAPAIGQSALDVLTAYVEKKLTGS